MSVWQSNWRSFELLVVHEGSKVVFELFLENFHGLTQFIESCIVVVVAGVFDLPALTRLGTGFVVTAATIRFRCDLLFAFDASRFDRCQMRLTDLFRTGVFQEFIDVREIIAFRWQLLLRKETQFVQ